jgi:hypothetical protein
LSNLQFVRPPLLRYMFCWWLRNFNIHNDRNLLTRRSLTFVKLTCATRSSHFITGRYDVVVIPVSCPESARIQRPSFIYEFSWFLSQILKQDKVVSSRLHPNSQFKYVLFIIS